MHDGEHSDVIGLDRVQHAVWKAPNQSPPHRADDTSSRLRVLDDLRYAAFNSGDECRTQSDTLSLEVLGRLCELAFSQWMKARRVFHPTRARASRNTSCAERARSAAWSQLVSRRSASSAHRRAFSSSERSSRLARSFSAKRARCSGSSCSTWASSSSMLILRL